MGLLLARRTLLAAAGLNLAYKITQSLLFNDDDSPVMAYTPQTEGDRTKWTFSTWFKRGNVTSGDLICAGADNNNETRVVLDGNDKLAIIGRVSGSNVLHYVTNAILRDPTGWNHFVAQLDTTKSSGQVRAWINGEEITSWATSTDGTQGAEYDINSTDVHNLGRRVPGSGGSNQLDGYMAECVFIDGAALAATRFGEADDNGYWVPREILTDNFTASEFGTNGFYYDFSDTAAYGKDLKPRATISGTAGDYKIDNSVLFEGSSDYLSRTFGTPDSETTWTFSCWLKRTTSANEHFFSAERNSSSDGTYIRFNGSTDEIQFFNRREDTNTSSATKETTSKFRDYSAWQHVVVVGDSTNSVAEDRLRIYIDGIRVRDWDLDTDPVSGEQFHLFNAYLHYLGGAASGAGSQFYSGYMAEAVGIDGTAYDPTDFAEYDSDGNWVPKDPSGLTFGSNGFYLDFSNSGALGTDSSGNGNNFTVNGTITQTTDTPTDTSADDEGNLCSSWNPLIRTLGSGAFSNNNKTYTYTGTARRNTAAMFALPTSGKYCQAFSISAMGNNDWQLGLTDLAQAHLSYVDSGSSSVNGGDNLISTDGTNYKIITPTDGAATGLAAVDSNDEFWLAVDMDAGELWFGIYDNSAGSMVWYDGDGSTDADPGAGTLPTEPDITQIGDVSRLTWCCAVRDSVEASFVDEGNISGTIPTGFQYGFGTYNLPSPAITTPSDHFQAFTYTGTGSSKIVQLGGINDMQPDLVWIKNRDQADEHKIIDAVRGVTEELSSDSTNAEATDANGLTSFNTNGFTLGTGANGYNDSSEGFAAWCWKASGSSVSNSDGSITSTVSANTTAGFSIVTYTGNATAGASIGHGLGAAPKMIIVKDRTTGSTLWPVYHESLGATDFVKLNNTDATASNSGNWNDTAPTSSVFTLGTNSVVNSNGDDYVAYCWSEIEGFSKFGSYTGNGSADGPFVYTGFRPAFIMIKRTDTTSQWVTHDSARETANPSDAILLPNTSGAESVSTYETDFLSNGFKFRNTNAAHNASGGTYIYMAFAEHPLGGSGVSQARARGESAPFIRYFSSGAANLAAADQVADSPTDSVDDGVGNFATLNPLYKPQSYASNTFSNGNKTVSAINGVQAIGTLSIPGDGHFYFEFDVDNVGSSWYNLGLRKVSATNQALGQLSGSGNGVYVYSKNGSKYEDGTLTTSWGDTYTTGDVIGLEYNNGTFKVYKNNSLVGTLASGMDTDADYYPYVITDNVTAGATVRCDPGDFSYSLPSGAKALATHNLPTTAGKLSDHFKTVLYTGDGTSARKITTDIEPDLVWVKSRDGARDHIVANTIRGASAHLSTNLTDAEGPARISDFFSDGFRIDADAETNTNGEDFVSWSWSLPTDETNSDGTITTTLKKNTTLGVTIGTYTGNATAGATIGHGGGKKPFMVIVKSLTEAVSWYVWHEALTAGTRLLLNNTSAETTDSTFNSIDPDASNVTLGGNGFGSNDSGESYLFIAFFETDFCKPISYTGNGSTDGPVQYLDGQAVWELTKRFDSTGSWPVRDDTRNTANPITNMVFTESANAEVTSGADVDFVATGRKTRTTGAGTNASGGTYCGVAFVEPINPTGPAQSRPLPN